ncbi:superfamily I DNA and/or RNA helicase [Desulfitispora alkaliphila]|uniref:hypothetical protein n=1 Tax=Desulfitispora alkaliphila TaxID=622674 RepID=UPI003D1FBA3A
MVSALIKHLLNNGKLIEMLDGENIFYQEKPIQFNPKQFILIKDKLLGDAWLKEYQIQVDCISKDLNKVIDLESELREYLNDLRGQKHIEGIKLIKTLNGGGTIKDEQGNWIKVVYFLLKI